MKFYNLFKVQTACALLQDAIMVRNSLVPYVEKSVIIQEDEQIKEKIKELKYTISLLEEDLE